MHPSVSHPTLDPSIKLVDIHKSPVTNWEYSIIAVAAAAAVVVVVVAAVVVVRAAFLLLFLVLFAASSSATARSLFDRLNTRVEESAYGVGCVVCGVWCVVCGV